MTVNMESNPREKYSVDVDIFSPESLNDPYDNYEILREAGPLAYMQAHDIWVAARYDQVKRILGDADNFLSGQGIGLNDRLNEAWAGFAPTSDGADHAVLRKVMMRAFGPKSVAQYADVVAKAARELVDEILDKGEFDAVNDFSVKLPTRIVVDLMGLSIPQDRREEWLHWSTDAYNCTGPEGSFEETWPSLQKLYDFAVANLTPDKVAPGSIGADTWQAVENGEIGPEQAVGILNGYATAGLDTTSAALGGLMMLLSEHPDQWAIVRDDQDLVPSAAYEGVRFESPAQWFSRVTAADVTFDDITIPAGTRMIHCYASANRDPRHYENPDVFDVRRNPTDSLAFGFGRHSCMGRNMSNLETFTVLRELASRVRTIEPAGQPRRHINALIRSLESVPVRVQPK